MACLSVLSTEADGKSASRAVIDGVSSSLEQGAAELVLLFGSIDHAETLGTIARELLDRRLAEHVVGCTGESIVGEDREVEASPAVSLWAIRHEGLKVRPRRLTSDVVAAGEFANTDAKALLLLGDPFSFRAEQFLRGMNEHAAGVVVVGGMASGSQMPNRNRLVLDREVHEDGAVAVEIEGPLRLRTVVSQGCRPIGRPLIVTKAHQNLIYELGRRPALEVFREVYESLDQADQDRLQQGLHIGRVINEYQESFHRGDFLVRNVLGADDSGGIAITDLVRVGQTVQFHVRDAETADEDLRGLLESDRRNHPGGRVLGALLFSCNGRGTRLFPQANHDVGLVREVVGPVPVGGFFAMGEIGPVGGQNFVHGYTASIVLFEETGAG